MRKNESHYYKKLLTYRDNLYKLYYREKPAPILQFIEDPYFLGKSTNFGKAISPIWKQNLKEIFYDDSKYLVVFTGAIGTGKTTAAIIGIAYVIYRLMCLKDMWSYFELSDSGKASVSFFNLTKSLSHSRGFRLLQMYLLESQWFWDHGGVLRGSKDKYMDLPLFEWTLASPYSKGFGIQGANVVVAIMDEVDSPTESKQQKERVLSAYESTVRRFDSRFVRKGSTLGRFFLVASKQDEMSFLNTFVDEMKNSGRVYLVDIPLWAAKPAKLYSGQKFYVSVGDLYNQPKILAPEEVDKAKLDGFKVVEVPIEYRNDFERDLVGALRDIAGIAVRGVRKSKLFPSEWSIESCYDPEKADPVKILTIEIGLKDEVELIRYIDLNKIRLPGSVPRVISCDIAFSGDALGLAMSGIKSWILVEGETADGSFIKTRAPVVETDFVLRIKAKEGDRIPLHKVRKLILDLRTAGFNIVKYTADLQLASEDTRQILERAGISTEYFSVDKDIKYYLDFRDMVYQKRWICHRNEYLHFELKHLEYDVEKKKVDHPEKVSDVIMLEDGSVKEVVLQGSKDMADAVCASVAVLTKDSVAPMDVEGMKQLMQNLASEQVQVSENKYWWAKDETTGQGVVAADKESLEKFKNLLRRMR